MTDLVKEWPAHDKWNWAYFKEVVGNVEVGVYNNIKSDAYTPVNKADDYMKFGKYLDMLQEGPVELRIFSLIYSVMHPEIVQDFTWPRTPDEGICEEIPHVVCRWRRFYYTYAFRYRSLSYPSHPILRQETRFAVSL
jgi:hypothetical protein